MRRALLLFFLAAPGCAHNYLEHNTLQTAGTLSSLQTQQVMDNLARLCANPKANPTHVTLSAGLIQVADQGTGALAATLQNRAATILSPGLSAQRGLVEQWSVAPIVDGSQLETLQVAYRKALMPNEPDADAKLKEQIVDLAVRFTLLPSKKTIVAILTEHGEDCEPGPNEIAAQLRITLGREIAQLRKAAEAANKAMGQEKGKAYFDLAMKKQELEAALETRAAQFRLLLELGPKKADERKECQKKKESKDKTEAKTEDEKKKAAMKAVEEQNKKADDLKKQGNEAQLPDGVVAPQTPRRALPASSSRRGPTQGDNSAETSSTTLLILTALQAKSPAGYLPRTDLLWQSVRNPALVDQAEDQIAALESLLNDDEFKAPWLCCSTCRKDIPHCACAVGHAKVCGQECHVWVMPGDLDKLHKFTRIIMTLTSNAQQDIPPPSPAFSPTLLR